MSSDQYKIEVKNVTKKFVERRKRSRNPARHVPFGEENLVLNNISFNVKSGEFIMIIGHSGCGKSTLLNIISGFDTPSEGYVKVDGKKVTGPDASRMFIFQQNSLLPWLTVGQNIQSALKKRVDKGMLEEKMLEYLRMVDLQNFADYYPHQISGGMGRLAELARALALDPEILFMDEPFAALDFMTRCLMREEMLNLMAIFKKTILFITHDIDEAIQLGDKVIIMSDRPSQIKKMFDLSGFAHPRDISTGELGQLRREAYLQMGVNPII
jgi:ABC-type nitrate/sulfonate/bicarbonate transport system ATPase subunit